MVVDACVLLAVWFDEEHAAWAADQLNEHVADLLMSTVNLAEALILLRDRRPQAHKEIEESVLESGIRFVAPSVAQARLAVEARLRFPLNLGDCFAYALAMAEQCPVLTLDHDFIKTDCVVVIPERSSM